MSLDFSAIGEPFPMVGGAPDPMWKLIAAPASGAVAHGPVRGMPRPLARMVAPAPASPTGCEVLI
jgi:hypothetical protein